MSVTGDALRLHEEDFDALATAVNLISERYGPILDRMEWVSLGGGISFTTPGYPIERFCSMLRDVADRFGVQIYLGFKNSSAEPSGKEAGESKETAEGAPGMGRWYAVVGSIIVYMGLIFLIGFGAASLVFGIALPYYGGYRRMKVVIPVALGMTIGLVVIGRLFNIPLPEGLWTALLQQ